MSKKDIPILMPGLNRGQILPYHISLQDRILISRLIKTAYKEGFLNGMAIRTEECDALVIQINQYQKIMKQKVIKFFQNLPAEKHEQFNEAFKLYRECPNKSVNLERAYNSGGYTERNLKNLLYDLQVINLITDIEKVRREELDSLKEEIEDLQVDLRQAQDDGEELEFENLDLKEEIETLKLAPKLDAKQIRVEFPFLNEKDCPDEFKILVADKITAWNSYLATHEYLLKIEAGEIQESDEHKAELAKEAIEAFDENKKIYDELNCYQTTGKVLGVHPIFKKLQLSREVETMTADELIKYKGSSAKYFSVKKVALEKAKKAKDTAKAEEIQAGIAERSEKLFLVNKKLGV